MSNDKILLDVRNVRKYFKGRKRGETVKAVDDVSFTLARGETLGLVGESGCGKSTLGRVILRLVEPTAGEAFFDGRDALKLPEGELNQMRRRMQMIFQNPYSSLNPRMTVLESVRAPLDIFKIGTKEERFELCRDILQYVGLNEDQIYRPRDTNSRSSSVNVFPAAGHTSKQAMAVSP